MGSKRYEYAAVKVAPDQTPVPDLNKLGTDGYHVVATMDQVLVLERQVKAHKGYDADEEEQDG